MFVFMPLIVSMMIMSVAEEIISRPEFLFRVVPLTGQQHRLARGQDLLNQHGSLTAVFDSPGQVGVTIEVLSPVDPSLFAA